MVSPYLRNRAAQHSTLPGATIGRRSSTSPAGSLRFCRRNLPCFQQNSTREPPGFSHGFSSNPSDIMTRRHSPSSQGRCFTLNSRRRRPGTRRAQTREEAKGNSTAPRERARLRAQPAYRNRNMGLWARRTRKGRPRDPSRRAAGLESPCRQATRRPPRPHPTRPHPSRARARPRRRTPRRRRDTSRRSHRRHTRRACAGKS